MNQHVAPPRSCLDAALDYARRGWHVFPATVGQDGAKKSYVAGQHGNGRRWGNTTEEALIRDYWQRFPDAMLGIACGPDSGLFVVEADTLEAHGQDGIGNLERLFAAQGGVPDTIEALSPSGSRHLYFAWPETGGISNSASRIAAGIDVRGEGGMVIAPPSVKPGTAIPYHWRNPPGLFDLAPCPDWLLARIRKPASAERPAGLRIDAGPSVRDGTQADTGEVAELLSWIDPDAGGYQAWLDVLMALHDHFAGNDTGLGLAEDWSARGAKFRPGEVPGKWQGFTGGGGIRIGTIAARARQGGADLGEIARRHLGANKPRDARLGDANLNDAPPHVSRGSTIIPQSEGMEQHAMNAGPSPHGAQTVSQPPLDDDVDLSHDALARGIGHRGWDRDAKHVAAQGCWYFWDGSRWCKDDRLQHMTMTRAYLVDRAGELIAWSDRKAAREDEKEAEKLRRRAAAEARSLRSAPTVAAVAGLARSNPASVASAADFDCDRLILGTPSGTVDLRTGNLRPGRRGDMVTKLTAVAPAPPGSATPVWNRFLAEVFDGDSELIAFLQRAAGYALTGLTSEHKLLFLYGTGRNGKSTFLDLLQWLWGDYARRAPAVTFLSSAGERHPTDIAGLNAARLVVGSELPKGKSWDEAVLKDLTGGDRMTARFMRGDFFDFDPQLTLMIAGNTMPSFRGVDEALRARVVMVPFTVTIPPERRDPFLKDKLRAEGPAILRWAIEGALAWQQCGLDVPARVATASTEYLDGEDTLGQFLADETVPEPGTFTLTAALHLRFRQWMDTQGLAPWTSHTLTKELKSRGFQDGRRTQGRGFVGLRLRPAGPV